MNGTLALLIALISYGNEYLLKGPSFHQLDFNNSTLLYCNTIEFNTSDSSSNILLVASSPQRWFEFLKKGGCKKLRICYRQPSNGSRIRDYQSDGFLGGGEKWLVEAVYANYSSYWAFEQQVTKPGAVDKRLLSVKLNVVQEKSPQLLPILPLDQARQGLSAALAAIENFASNNNQDKWAGIFKKAFETLNSPKPAIDYYKDFIISDQYSLPRKQLLFSASLADVFGGIGSWNDILYSNIEQNKVNIQLSADLYDKINAAVVAAVNSN
jgi:high-affinity Fe2+/Pb2+ permease